MIMHFGRKDNDTAENHVCEEWQLKWSWNKDKMKMKWSWNGRRTKPTKDKSGQLNQRSYEIVIFVKLSLEI